MEILVLTQKRPLPEDICMALRTAASDASFVVTSTAALTAKHLKCAEVIFGNPAPELLKHAKALRWLQLYTSDSSSYSAPGIIPMEALLTSAKGAYGLAVSEHLLAMLLSFYKKLHLYYAAQQSHTVSDFGTVRTVAGSTALILGAGDIGGALAWQLKALGAYTIGVKRSITQKLACFDELYTMAEINSLLQRADIVVSLLPKSNATFHLLDAGMFSLMRKNAVFLHAGGEGVVDIPALCTALQGRWIMGACLDMAEMHSFPAQHPIWGFKNLLLTPHVAGDEHLLETAGNVYRIWIENLEAYIDGKPLQNVVSIVGAT